MSEGTPAHASPTTPFHLKQRPWPVRFWRHYCIWCQNLGVVASVRHGVSAMSDNQTTEETSIIHMRQVEMLRAKLTYIERIATFCCHEMQGRINDDLHRRAFLVLEEIVEIAHD